MIVTCERCETQFQLDEARVPDDGARVRCSRCKHAFVVQRPAASADEAIHRAADEAARSGETPEATRDLPDPAELSGADWEFNVDDAPPDDELAPAGLGDASDALDDAPARFEKSDDVFSAVAEPQAPEAPESDFGLVGPDDSLSLATEDDAASEEEGLALAGDTEADSLFGDDFDASPETPASREAPLESAPAPAPVEQTRDPLGSHDEWDLFDDAAGSAAPSATIPAERDLAEVAAFETAPDPVPARAAAPRARPRLDLGFVRHAGAGVGWLATVALVSIGLWRGLAPATPTGATASEIPGVVLEDVQGRWVENAHLGRVYVVTGSVAAPDASRLPPLALVLRDAGGQALDPAIPLGDPRPARVLREGDERAMRDRPFRSGVASVARPFEAVAWPLPADAVRFEVVSGAPDR